MKKLYIILYVIGLMILLGCNTQTEEENDELCKEDCLADGWQYGKWIGLNLCNCYNETKIEEIEKIKEVKIPCNLTYPNRLELIRRLKFLEGQQDKWIMDETECVYNITEEKLQNCEGKIDMHKRDIEELEDELDECEDGFCEYNESWC